MVGRIEKSAIMGAKDECVDREVDFRTVMEGCRTFMGKGTEEPGSQLEGLTQRGTLHLGGKFQRRKHQKW